MAISFYRKHGFCNFIVTGNSIVDITDLTDRQYELLFRHLDGYEVTIYPGGSDASTVITKRYSNPAYEGYVITKDNIKDFIKAVTTENRTVISVCEWGKSTIYNTIEDLLKAIPAFCKNCNSRMITGRCYKN